MPPRSRACSPARSRTGTTRRSPRSTRTSTLPDLAVTPVHRADDSGTTENFTDYLFAGRPRRVDVRARRRVAAAERRGRAGHLGRRLRRRRAATARSATPTRRAPPRRASAPPRSRSATSSSTYSPEAAAAIVDASPLRRGPHRGRPRHRARPHLGRGRRLPDRPRQLHDRVRGVRRPGDRRRSSRASCSTSRAPRARRPRPPPPAARRSPTSLTRAGQRRDRPDRHPSRSAARPACLPAPGRVSPDQSHEREQDAMTTTATAPAVKVKQRPGDRWFSGTAAVRGIDDPRDARRCRDLPDHPVDPRPHRDERGRLPAHHATSGTTSGRSPSARSGRRSSRC